MRDTADDWGKNKGSCLQLRVAGVRERYSQNRLQREGLSLVSKVYASRVHLDLAEFLSEVEKNDVSWNVSVKIELNIMNKVTS